MSKSGQQPSKADVGGQRAPEGPASGGETKATGQKVSLERGKATHKKNPGKRAKAGGS
ncbi:MAG TPA: hypothetical protein VIP10_14695 [Burkholderiaceae bacterium]